MRRDRLEAFAITLSSTDVVVVEETGNAAAMAAVISPHVKRVVIANPMQVRVIAHAEIKTDTIDAGVLAQLYASVFLPDDERPAIDRHLREFDRLAQDLQVIERDLARSALADESVARWCPSPVSTWWWRLHWWQLSAMFRVSRRRRSWSANSG